MSQKARRLSIEFLSEQVVNSIVNNVSKEVAELSLIHEKSSEIHDEVKHLTAQHLKQKLAAASQYVELILTARIHKNGKLSGSLFMNTNDERFCRQIRELIEKNEVQGRVIQRGIRLSRTRTVKTVEETEEELMDRIKSLKEVLQSHKYGEGTVFDMTTAARLRDGYSRIAFERAIIYQRCTTAAAETEKGRSQARQNQHHQVASNVRPPPSSAAGTGGDGKTGSRAGGRWLNLREQSIPELNENDLSSSSSDDEANNGAAATLPIGGNATPLNRFNPDDLISADESTNGYDENVFSNDTRS